MPAKHYDSEEEKLRARIVELDRLAHARWNEGRRLIRELGKEREERERVEVLLDLVRQIDDARPTAPKWRKIPAKSKRANHAIPTLFLSDLHLDEVVNPAEVEWFNAYDRDIAERRLERTVQTAIKLSRDYTAGVTFDGFVLALGGDLLSGDIHDELKATNETTIFDSVVHWVPRLAQAVEALAEEFGNVYVPCVVGNHDRSPGNKRPPSKRRATDSLSWIIYKWLADRFASDERVTFEVAEGADLSYDVYGTRYLLTHGDQFRGGNGIAGVMSPIARGHAKKSQRQQTLGRPFDWLILGHFHSYLMGRGFLINGSMKGADEYSFTNNFDLEPPQQAFWLTTPERGITMTMPVHCTDPKEPWLKRRRIR